MTQRRMVDPRDEGRQAQQALELARSGVAHLQAGRLSQAEYDLYRASLLNPEQPHIRGYFALALHHQGKTVEAYRELQAALGIAPEDATLLGIRDSMRSAAEPEQATAPAHDAHAHGKAQARAATSEADAAIARLETAIAATPGDSRLHRELSLVYARLGRLAEAKEQMRLAESMSLRRAHGTT